jgi:hypothetical protein
VVATRYVTPLREGGSLPGLVEADDDGLYVVKFRGAGQGPKARVAEILAGELARSLALPVPELVYVELDPAIGNAEPDPEIQDLLKASGGVNVGLDFLPGALSFDEDAARRLDPSLAAEIVWLDALMLNVDRTPRNPNLLVWHGRLWLIDHGAALYVQHGTPDLAAEAGRAFAQVRDHVLLPHAGSITEADQRLGERLPDVASLVSLVPEDWLGDGGPEPYVEFLRGRLSAPRAFAEEAERVRIA